MDPDRLQRKNLRLPGFDYSHPGAYFITACTKKRLFLIDPAPVRSMIRKWWQELPHKFGNVEIDEFVTMPNHIHGIIILKEIDPVRADGRIGPQVESISGGHAGPPLPDAIRGDLCVAPLPAIVRWFKTMTTNDYIRGVKQLGWLPFPKKLWHRNYYEHIIRDSQELEAIRCYIRENPIQWQFDRDNPTNFNSNSSKTGTDYLAEFRY